MNYIREKRANQKAVKMYEVRCFNVGRGKFTEHDEPEFFLKKEDAMKDLMKILEYYGHEPDLSLENLDDLDPKTIFKFNDKKPCRLIVVKNEDLFVDDEPIPGSKLDQGTRKFTIRFLLGHVSQLTIEDILNIDASFVEDVMVHLPKELFK